MPNLIVLPGSKRERGLGNCEVLGHASGFRISHRSDWSQCARAGGSLGVPTLHPSSQSRREEASLGFEFTCG